MGGSYLSNGSRRPILVETEFGEILDEAYFSLFFERVGRGVAPGENATAALSAPADARVWETQISLSGDANMVTTCCGFPISRV